MGVQGRPTDPATRERIVRELAEGLSRRNVARRNRVSTWTVHQIWKEALAPPETADENKPVFPEAA